MAFHLTRRCISAAGALGGRIALALGVRKEVTEENLVAAYPNADAPSIQRIMRSAYSNLGRVFFEMFYLRYASRGAITSGLTVNNLPVIKRVVERNKGVILLSAHLGNWEWMALGVGAHLGIPLHIIVKNQRSNFSDRFLTALRTRFGNEVIPAGDGRQVFKALLEKKVVAMLGDQAAPANSVRVPFFGRLVPTFEGVARFALKTRCTILLGECSRTNIGTYEMTFHEIPFDDLSDASEENIRILTERHTQALEHIIRKEPGLWLWQHKRWKDADPI